jgi:hypothetical protein
MVVRRAGMSRNIAICNLLGSYQEFGAAGTAGHNAIMIWASSGFRGGIWMASNQMIQGGTVAAGFSAGSRLGASTVFGRAGGVTTDFAQPAGSLPNNPFTLLSREPGACNSPNQLSVFWLGEALSKAQVEQMEGDVFEYMNNIGVWQQIEVQPRSRSSSAWRRSRRAPRPRSRSRSTTPPACWFPSSTSR